jgi:hypothetical protein
MQDSAQANLDDQIADIVAFIDPVYTGAVTADATWDPNAYAWTEPMRLFADEGVVRG